MKISRYKKRANACYSVYLDDGREFVFYEDVLIQSELLIKREILEKDLEKIQKWNQEYDVYYVGLNSLKSKYRSTYELKEYLRKKEYPLDLIEKAITKLTEQGYLNDRTFAKSYIHSQMITTNHGPKRIEKDLMNKEIPSNIIQEEIEEFTKEDKT
jgi:regulatory protein